MMLKYLCIIGFLVFGLVNVNALITEVDPAAGGGGGNVTMNENSTDNAVARWSGAGGDTLQDSSVIISDVGHLTMDGTDRVYWNGVSGSIYHSGTQFYMVTSTSNMIFDPGGSGTFEVAARVLPTTGSTQNLGDVINSRWWKGIYGNALYLGSASDTNVSVSRNPGGIMNLTDNTGSYTLQDLLGNSTTYFPTNITVEEGTQTSGNLSSIQSVDDDYFNVTEVGGGNPLMVDVNFTGVSNFGQVLMKIWYEGGQGHDIDISTWNFATGEWETHGDLTDQSGLVEIVLDVLDPANHIDGGVVHLRFDHIENGIASHAFRIDYIVLQEGSTTFISTMHDALLNRDNTENHPWAFPKDGSKQFSGILNVSDVIYANSSHEVCTAENGLCNQSEATKEFFVPVSWGDGTEGVTGDFYRWRISGGTRQFVVINLFIPQDFTGIGQAEFILIPVSNGTIGFSVTTDYGAGGEDYNTHSGSSGGIPTIGIANQITPLDFAQEIGSAAAGDYIGVTITDDGGLNVDYDIVGLRLLYT